MITPNAQSGELTYQEKMTQKQYEFKYQQDLKTYSDKVETYYQAINEASVKKQQIRFRDLARGQSSDNSR